MVTNGGVALAERRKSNSAFMILSAMGILFVVDAHTGVISLHSAKRS